MKRILFVCLGNICRSPMAEVIFKNMIREKHLEGKYEAASGAVSREEEGNGLYPPAKKELLRHQLVPGNHRARQISPSDYEKYDLFIGMDESNLRGMRRILGKDPLNKIHKLLDYTSDSKDVEDPWYTGRFEHVFDEIERGCQGLLLELEKE